MLATHYLIYALDGIGRERSKLYGRVFEATAEILFMLLLILIAKGYTVTRARLRQASAIKVSIFVCCYCITFAILFVFEQMYFDPGQVGATDFITLALEKLCNTLSEWIGKP